MKLAVASVVVGAVLVAAGAAMWHPAAGLIAAGVFLVAGGLLADTGRRAGGDAR